MTPDTLSTIEAALDYGNQIILALKASGGYKYRKAIKGSEKEIDDFVAESAGRFLGYLVENVVAEEMLQEVDTCLYSRCRWDEYRRRVAEAHAAITEARKGARNETRKSEEVTEPKGDNKAAVPETTPAADSKEGVA